MYQVLLLTSVACARAAAAAAAPLLIFNALHYTTQGYTRLCASSSEKHAAVEPYRDQARRHRAVTSKRKCNIHVTGKSLLCICACIHGAPRTRNKKIVKEKKNTMPLRLTPHNPPPPRTTSSLQNSQNNAYTAPTTSSAALPPPLQSPSAPPRPP
jgi:hypothetical protein